MSRRFNWLSSSVWANERFLRVVLQALFAGLVIVVVGVLYFNMLDGLRALGLSLQWNFFGNEAGFGISEGISYAPSDTYGRAFVVGLMNTVKVGAFGVVLATIVGIVVGIARLSSNWLLRKVSTFYVEVFRNTPLLLQLIFWYTAVMIQLPSVRQSLHIGNLFFFNNRGSYLPAPVWTDGTLTFIIGLAIAVVAAFGTRWAFVRRRTNAGDPAPSPVVWSVVVGVVVAAAGWLAAPSSPIGWDVPALAGFNFRGGMRLSPELSALLVGLVAYTGAFIAEVVRGGIQAVSRGQKEAAEALGLSAAQTMRLVVLPQAFRIMIPPLTSQYLNLVKNSSLAIAIGYPDLYNVSNTILNQTGQPIAVFALVMGSYLVISLATSLFLNWYNRRMQLA